MEQTAVLPQKVILDNFGLSGDRDHDLSPVFHNVLLRDQKSQNDNPGGIRRPPVSSTLRDHHWDQ